MEPHQEMNEREESQSLLQPGINCQIFAGDVCQKDPPGATTLPEECDQFMGLDSEVTGFLETGDEHIVNYDGEDTPEISLLSNVNASEVSSKDSVRKDKEMEEVFENIRMTSDDKDMADVIPSVETMVFGITENGKMAENTEDKHLMELLSDSETFQVLDMLEYQDDTFSVHICVSEENSALPVELLSALNSLSESVEASTISHLVEEGSGHSMAKKELPADKSVNDYTHVKQTDLKSQFHLQGFKETEALTAVRTPHSSEEQDSLTEKRSPVLKDTTSCEQPVQEAACVPKKSTRKRRKLTVNHLSSCQQLLEGLNKQINSCEAKARASAEVFDTSDTKDEKEECLQLGASSCRSSSSDINTKVGQVRKSRRIAKKKKQMDSKIYFSESSRNCISLSRINRRDMFGQTLLHRAAMEDDLDSICAMIKGGAKVNARDYAGWTPLHEASVAGCFETTHELLKAGADVNCKSHEHVTPLHDAVKEGHYKVAELLLWYGADPLLKNERGKSALEEATNQQMRKLLESYVARSTIHEASAERFTEYPVGDQDGDNKSKSRPKVKARSSERVQHSFIDNTRILKQYSVKLEKKKRKRSSKNNSASQTQNSCRILNETTLKDTCPILKAKQSVRKRATSSVHHQDTSDTIDGAAKEPSMLIGSEIQQESDLDKRNNDGSSETKEVYQSSEPAGTLKSQVTNPCIVTSLNPIQEESASPSLTNLVNESNLQKEEQCAMKHSDESPYDKVDILDDNLHSAEKIYVWSVREEGINLSNEKNRSQYVHSENSMDKINLYCQRDIVIERELRIPKESLPAAREPICLEPGSTTMLPEQETALLSDSDCTVISELCNLNADQNTDKNTSKAVETCNEQIVQVNMEIFSPSAFSQHINRTGVSEYPDTYSDSELTPSVNAKSILLGPKPEENMTCHLETSRNGSEVERNTFVTSQMLDKEAFQGEVLQLEECYEASRKENADNGSDVQSNELETMQSKRIQTKFHENSQSTHWFSSRNEKNVSSNDEQFSQTEEQHKPDSSASSHSKKRERKSSSSQLLYTTTAKINKTNTKGETALHLAAKKGDLALIKSLIASGACVNQKDYAGWTAIHEASSRGFTEIIAELLKAGADVNSKSLDGVLPIHDAVSGNHFEAVHLLLFHGANPNEADNCGGNALDEAICDKMKDLLKSYGATETKEIPKMNNIVGEKNVRPSRPRKTRTCYNCHDHLVFHSKPSGRKCVTHESISEVLQDIEEKQDRLSFFELRSQSDADLYIQKLSQIQNILNDVLAKQKSERDELAKKYRASVESFKQGALREQLVNLASRQKSLLLMAQTQKKLGQKIQNYKNTRKESSGSAKEVANRLSSGANSYTKNGTSDGTVPHPGIVRALKTNRVMENSFIEQEPRQHPNRSLDLAGGNVEIISQEVGSQNMVCENRFSKYNTEEVPNSKSLKATEQITLPSEHICLTQQSYGKEVDYIPWTLQGDKLLNGTSRLCISHNSEAGSIEVNSNLNQPTTESQHLGTKEFLQQCSNMNEVLQKQQELESMHHCIRTNILPNSRVTQDASLKATGTFLDALSKSKISQNTAQCSDSQYSEKQLKIKENRRKRNQLLDLLEQGKLQPGDDVLEFTLQNSRHKASLLGNGKVKTDSSVYQNPVQWIKALLGNDISVSWKYVWNKVTYCGTLLSKIIAENIPKETEVLLQQHKLSERNSIEWDHNEGEDYCCSGHQTTSFQDTDNIQQGVQNPLSTETQSEETLSAVIALKSSYQPTFSKTSRRFLQFNKIVLIKDEEFLPSHIMEQCWDFYVHCENFGF
nr:putative ankyrin repeat domain-containing protein 31 [Pogona vitticeps]